MPPLVRGSAIGACNICLRVSPLTDDHVPPKGVLRVKQVEMLNIQHMLALDRPVGRKRGRLMQSGVLFKSLCADCNNRILGARYDPELVQAANAVTDFLRTSVAIPKSVSVRLRPGLLARSVLGHMLAVGLNRIERTPLLDDVRQFVLDEERPMPADIDFHYWVYPYHRQLSLRDAAIALDFFSVHIVVWCLKFFPLGFLVTWGNEHPNRIPVRSIKPYMLHAGTHEVNLPFDLDRVPHQTWPEQPTDLGALLVGDASHGALPRGA